MGVSMSSPLACSTAAFKSSIDLADSICPRRLTEMADALLLLTLIQIDPIWRVAHAPSGGRAAWDAGRLPASSASHVTAAGADVGD